MRRKEALVLIVICVLYLVLWWFLPKPSFWGLDNGFKYQGARAFAETGQIRVAYTGADFDPQGGYRPMVFPYGVMSGNAQIPVFSVLFMVLGGFLINLMGAVGPYLLPLIGGWGCLLAGWFMWVRLRPGLDGRMFLIMLGLGSPLLFYSLTLWEHSLSMVFVILSFVFLIQTRELSDDEDPRTWEVTLAGFLIALATAFRTESIVWVGIPIFFWRATDRSLLDIGRYLIGFLAGMGGLIVLNNWATDSLLPLHIMSNFKVNQVLNYKDLFTSRLFNLYIISAQGFKDVYLSVLLLIPLVLTVFWRGWRLEKDWGYYLAAGVLVVWSIYFFTMKGVSNYASYTINTGGIFWVIPFSVLALMPIKSRKIERYWGLFWLSPLIYFVIVSAFAPTLRGVHWGPRFVIQAVPFMLLTASVRGQRWWNHYSITKPLIILLVLISVMNQIYSYDILYKTRRANLELNEWAENTSLEPALTSMWWLSGDVSLLSDRYPWYLTDTKGRINFVVDALRDRGVKKFNFYEREPYITDDFWLSIGTEPIGEDYFLDGDGRTRRRWFKILR
ncbi:MAG TPA: hypothetical protein ENL08_02820 [Bacteroidetes bacterium]|nr:hypothetical protein [Bacteroidota bacterium]